MPCQYTARLLCACSHLTDWRGTTESCQPNLSPLWPLVPLTRASTRGSVELCNLITAAPFSCPPCSVLFVERGFFISGTRTKGCFADVSDKSPLSQCNTGGMTQRCWISPWWARGLDWWVSLVTQDSQSGTTQFDFLNVYSFMDSKGKIKKKGKRSNARLHHADGCTPLVLFFIEPPNLLKLTINRGLSLSFPEKEFPPFFASCFFSEKESKHFGKDSPSGGWIVVNCSVRLRVKS